MTRTRFLLCMRFLFNEKKKQELRYSKFEALVRVKSKVAEFVEKKIIKRINKTYLTVLLHGCRKLMLGKKKKKKKYFWNYMYMSHVIIHVITCVNFQNYNFAENNNNAIFLSLYTL